MAFNAQGLLNQLLGAGQTSRQARQARPSGLGGGMGGSLAAGALGMLLGSRRGRGSGLLRTGGAAALGVLAYRAYSEWQSRQGGGGEARTLGRVSGAEAEAQSQAVLTAVVAAAKADGHIDEQEHAAIDAQLARLGDDPEAQRWLRREIAKPLDPAEVARAAESDVVAAEMYLASRMVIDTENDQERAYLNELARQLRLDPELQARLDREAEQAVRH
ncbi:MAG: tellurite resistance TerB family protein [Xanthomonadaceae bacterium]|nr:tellurite resistance TerB family protein [Xanthomonadaceae bacterium]